MLSNDMRDLHCHILPGVDDGAADLTESLAMLAAAQAAGINEIVCTPHCRDPYFDYEAMQRAFILLQDEAARDFPDMTLHMGFEVNHRKLQELGDEWIDRLAFADSPEFLLELSARATAFEFAVYERTVFEIQAHGLQVIIAHPERYHAIREDINLARRLVDMGCRLQASTDFIAGGRFGTELQPARRLLKEGLYTCFASDAHCVEHYALFSKAYERYGKYLPA